MSDYRNSKIYKIICNTTGLVYIGSTTRSLKDRLNEHINDNCSSKVIIDNNNYEIHLIVNYPCNSKQELEEIEGSYQKTLDCVNKRIEGSNKQSKEEKQKRQKKYYEENREKIRIHKKQFYDKKLYSSIKNEISYPINIKDEAELLKFITTNKKFIRDMLKKITTNIE